MGCSFIKEFQRRGYGTEAVDAIVSWTLSQADVDQVTANTPVTNSAAISVLQKLGFEQVESDGPGMLRFSKVASTGSSH